MVLAHDISVRMNLMSRDDADRVRAHLAAVGLPTRLADVAGGVPDANTFMDLIGQDKKVQRGALTFILSRGIGQSFIARDVPASEVKAFIADELSRGTAG